MTLQRLSDRIALTRPDRLDGWVLIRLKDVQAVSMDPDPECFEIKALKARDQWPSTAPELNLEGAVAVLTSASATAAIVSVFDEFDRPDVCWIGAVVSVDKSKLKLLEVNTRGGWARTPRTFDPAGATRIDLGGWYEEALQLVVVPPPIE